MADTDLPLSPTALEDSVTMLRQDRGKTTSCISGGENPSIEKEPGEKPPLSGFAYRQQIPVLPRSEAGEVSLEHSI